MFIAVLPLVACTTLSTEPATIVELVGYFSQSGEVPLQSHWWKSLPDAQLQTLEQTALAANPGLLATQARLAEAAALARKTGAQLVAADRGRPVQFEHRRYKQPYRHARGKL